MKEFEGTLTGLSERDKQMMGSNKLGPAMDLAGGVAASGAALGDVIAEDFKREFGIPTIGHSGPLFEDENPRPVVVQAPESEAQSVKPLENVFKPEPVSSSVEGPVIEGGVK